MGDKVPSIVLRLGWVQREWGREGEGEREVGGLAGEVLGGAHGAVGEGDGAEGDADGGGTGEGAPLEVVPLFVYGGEVGGDAVEGVGVAAGGGARFGRLVAVDVGAGGAFGDDGGYAERGGIVDDVVAFGVAHGGEVEHFFHFNEFVGFDFGGERTGEASGVVVFQHYIVEGEAYNHFAALGEHFPVVAGEGVGAFAREVVGLVPHVGGAVPGFAGEVVAGEGEGDAVVGVVAVFEEANLRLGAEVGGVVPREGDVDVGIGNLRGELFPKAGYAHVLHGDSIILHVGSSCLGARHVSIFFCNFTNISFCICNNLHLLSWGD